MEKQFVKIFDEFLKQQNFRGATIIMDMTRSLSVRLMNLVHCIPEMPRMRN